MKRRSFLRTSLFGAAALTLPGWLGCAFGSKSEWAFDDEDIQRGSAIGKAFLRAQSLGKPLLVVVVPPLPYSREQLSSLPETEKERYWAVSTERYERGHAFGELLNHGSEEQRWPLALCEVVCALPDEIDYLTGSFSGSPLMALLETEVKRPRAISFDGALPRLFDDAQVGDYEEQRKLEEQLIVARIALLAGLIKEAIAPDAKTLARRAKQLRDTLPAAQKGLEEKMRTKGFSVEQCDQIAGIVGEAATKSKSKPLFSLLALAVNERLGKAPAEGSRWANSYGCGTTYETPPKPKITKNPDGSTSIEMESFSVVGCGMGHMPEKSRRFLDFYSEESV